MARTRSIDSDFSFRRAESQVVAMSAILLTRRQITRLLTPTDCLQAVEAGFRATRLGGAHAPPPLHLAARDGGFHAKGAVMERGRRAYAAVKLNANFPGNPARGRPTIQGIVLLSDARTGAVLAIMDSIAITRLRTAAASALAARHLARVDASVLCVVGCGAQALAHLAALLEVRPIRTGHCHDIDRAKAARFAAKARRDHGITFEITADVASGAGASDIVVTCTTARSPILGMDDVAPGGFVAAVGADSPDKSEIAPDLMAKARVVVDSLDQCVAMGDLRHAIAAGRMSRADAHAELADVVTGARPGRTDAREIWVYDSTGTAVQDVACAALAFERARTEGIGLSIRLG